MRDHLPTFLLAGGLWFLGIAILLSAMSHRRPRPDCCERPRRRGGPTAWESYLAAQKPRSPAALRHHLERLVAQQLGVSLQDVKRALDETPSTRPGSAAADPPPQGEQQT